MGTKFDKLLQFLRRRETVAEPDGWAGHGESLPILAPNLALEPTRNSLRSCLAPAIARGSPRALDAKAPKQKPQDNLKQKA